MFFTYVQDCVKTIVVPVFDVVTEHKDDFVQVKFPASAESKEEWVVEPRVLCYSIHLNPLFELIEHFLLLLSHLSDVPIYNHYQ